MAKLSPYAREKVWVITGAGSGIGLEMTRALLGNGAIVWALDMDEESLQRLSSEALRDGRDLYTKTIDVTNLEATRRAIKEIATKSRRIDVWINNAGIQKVAPFSEQDPNLFNLIMTVNFHAVVEITRELLKQMDLQGQGTILNMASVAGHVPAPFMTAYVASKHAVLGFSRALRAELSMLKSPVRCAVASPGFVDTSIIDRGRHSGFPEWLSWMLAKPTDCAIEILEQLASGRDEIEPTLNGRAMKTAFKLLPEWTVKSSRVLLTRGFKDLVLNRIHVPHG